MKRGPRSGGFPVLLRPGPGGGRSGRARPGRGGGWPALAAGLLAVTLTLAGCGKKGDPEPPLRLVPRAAADLAVAQRGDELILRVGYPSVATNGMALPGLAAVELWRSVQPVSGTAPPRPPEPRQFQGAAKILASLTAAELTAAVRGDRIEVRWPVERAHGDSVPPERLPAEAASTALPPPPASAAAGEAAPAEAAAAPRWLHTYGVRFVSSRGETSDFSNLAAIVPLPPPAPPGDLEAQARQDGIRISWAPPEGAPGTDEPASEEAAVQGFRVYRRGAEERRYGEVLAAVGGGKNRYLDATARYGERYIYTVTTVAATDPLVESAFGGEREVDYRDRFPPPSPGDLVALAEAGQVRLSWRAAEAPDTAGYHVYRRSAAGGAFERRTSRAVTETRFLDTGLTAARGFVYRVTAVDASGNESAPSAEVEATAR